MADVFSRRNALLGWLVWKLAKRRLRAPLGAAAGRGSRRGRIVRLATAVAVLAVLAAARGRRAGRDGGSQA